MGAAERQVQVVIDDFGCRERQAERGDLGESLGAAGRVGQRGGGAGEAGDPPSLHHNGIVERAALQLGGRDLEQLVEFHQLPR